MGIANLFGVGPSRELKAMMKRAKAREKQKNQKTTAERFHGFTRGVAGDASKGFRDKKVLGTGKERIVGKNMKGSERMGKVWGGDLET